ncbi:MAG: hypothetical protein QE159_06685 [Candidatus Verstraetearchaeota archaeon]|nr:hypothetical protein [Candidatus Verstraetearchaeota archaeon]
MRVALIIPSNATGGVATIFHNLHKGIISEGIHVGTIKLGKKRFGFLTSIYHSFLNTKYLTDYDIALYIGNVPWSNHVLTRLLGIPIALFLHGFVFHELVRQMLYGVGAKNKITGPNHYNNA